MDLSYLTSHQSDILMALGQHVRLTLITLALALLIAVPIGTLVSRFPILYTPVLTLFGIIYTIPSLALLALLVPPLGIGQVPALVALVAYAQFILVRNVVVGLRSVNPAIIDAARGMGMDPWQTLVRVEFPLALPVVMAGIRIATVATIAIATIASLIDGGGLGLLLFQGINNGYNSEIVSAALMVSLLAIAADILLRLINRLLPATRARRLT